MPWGHTLHSLQLRCATSLSMRSLSSPRFSKHGKHNHRFSSGDASCALSFVHLRGNGCSDGVSVLPVADVVLPTFVHDVSAPDVVAAELVECTSLFAASFEDRLDDASEAASCLLSFAAAVAPKYPRVPAASCFAASLKSPTPLLRAARALASALSAAFSLVPSVVRALSTLLPSSPPSACFSLYGCSSSLFATELHAFFWMVSKHPCRRPLGHRLVP